MEADVIVYDALVPEAVVAMGRRDAERIGVGKRKGCHSKSQAEINALLVELGQDGKRVVRLKSGDPLVFGRAGEEMQALRDAGIPFDVVPGVTAAFAAAADFELPLTLRGVSSSMVFTTGHDLKGGTLPDWAKLAISGATVAVYMGRSVAADVAGRLIDAGLSPDTAVAVVENASLPGRRRFHGTLADLPSLQDRDDLVRSGHDHHRRRGGRRRLFALDAAVGLRAGTPSRAGVTGMKILTANRLTDGEAVWYSASQGWAEMIGDAEIVSDKAGEARLEAAGQAALAGRPGRRRQPDRRRAQGRRHHADAAARTHPRRRPDQPHGSRQAGARKTRRRRLRRGHLSPANATGLDACTATTNSTMTS